MPLTRADHSVEVLAPPSPGAGVGQSNVENRITQSIDPQRVRRYFDELRDRYSVLFEQLTQDPERLEWAALVFASSQFLSEEILRYPSWIFDLADISRTLSRDDYKFNLQCFIDDLGVARPSAAELALFRRKELLRILIRDQLRLGTLAEITEELSNVADAVLSRALAQVTSELQPRFGTPIETEAERDGKPAAFTVLALGKLGGRELNYSSDIDLMFLYSANGETSGPQQVTNKEFFKKLANQLTTLLSTYTPAGQCYRLDLRLRPEGSHGEVCISLAAAKEYYAHRARDWELQMLLKARVAAGNEELGRDLLASVEPLIYSTTLDFSTIETMSATRERIGEKFARKSRRPGEVNVKLTRGGIRDIEFLIQCLQRLHGSRDPSLKDRGTLSALGRLHEKDLLSTTEFARLTDAYVFLRRVEHVLQFEHDRQTHALPSKPVELESIARGVAQLSGEAQPVSSPSTLLLRELNQHFESVQAIYDRIVHAQRPLHYTASPVLGSFDETANSTEEPHGSVSHDELFAKLEGVAPELVERVRSAGTRSLKNGLADFLEALVNLPRQLSLVCQNGAVASWALQLFELSPLLATQLVRAPELVEELRRSTGNPGRRYAFEGLAAPLNDIVGLQRFFRREMFRIQASSVCRPEPIFQTLDQTSALAEFVIARAYRIALETALAHARSHATLDKPFEEPQAEMMVVALGRLGMREFDIGSDADLLFIIPEAESVRQRFWTRVAERLLEILSTYTESGPILSIDTRLRPNGREGMLVQSESKYVEYFSSQAEAWEGIAYMKARGVAGDTDRATQFLAELQQVDWRRYGQGGRSKFDLRQMRLRLEREQGTSAPLKAAQGGYYDADFILMYLRLRGAGLFFKSLNTPERIDIVEKMGHLERADAEFLLDATTHFRALDHALRLATGHAEGEVPASLEQRTMIAELMNRWSSHESAAENLDLDLFTLQTKMHRLFEAVFAQ